MKKAPTNSFTVIRRPEIGIFIRRLNRFVCTVEINGEVTDVYMVNTGRLEELLIPGKRVILEKRRDYGKTHYDMILIETPSYTTSESIWVNLDSRLPPKLLAWAIKSGFLPQFEDTSDILFEPAIGSGRFDLLIKKDGKPMFIETKSVNLVDVEGTARFPDAKTIRGTRHIRELTELRRDGTGACLAFIVTRPDAQRFSPFSERDLEFSKALTEAQNAGVEIIAPKFRSGYEFEFVGEIPLEIPGEAFPGFWPPIE